MIVGTHPLPASVPGMKFFQGYIVTDAKLSGVCPMIGYLTRQLYSELGNATRKSSFSH